MQYSINLQKLTQCKGTITMIKSFIQDVAKKAVRPTFAKGTAKEEKQEKNKAYYNAMYEAVRVLPKTLYTALTKKVTEFKQKDGSKPYASIEDFFLKHIAIETGKTYKKHDGSEGIAVGVSNETLANRFANVFMNEKENNSISNQLLTLISSHLAVNGKIGTRFAGFGKIIFTMPNAEQKKKSPAADALDIPVS